MIIKANYRPDVMCIQQANGAKNMQSYIKFQSKKVQEKNDMKYWVATYINKNLNPQIIKVDQYYIINKFQIATQTFVVINLYARPAYKKKIHLEISKLFQQLRVCYNNIMVIGDWNQRPWNLKNDRYNFVKQTFKCQEVNTLFHRAVKSLHVNDFAYATFQHDLINVEDIKNFSYFLSDHAPIVLDKKMPIGEKISTYNIVNKQFNKQFKKITQIGMQMGQSLEIIPIHTNKTPQKPKYIKSSQNLFSKEISSQGLHDEIDKISKFSFDDQGINEYQSQFNMVADQTIDKRFSQYAKQAFDKISLICKTKEQKRDGNSVSKIITQKGRILDYSESMDRIAQHYVELHTNQKQDWKGPQKMIWQLPPQSHATIFQIAIHGGFRRAGGYDGLSKQYYNFTSKKGCQNPSCKITTKKGLRQVALCTKCGNRLKILTDLSTKEFWEKVDNNQQLKKKIFTARINPLNKVFPKIPLVNEYRPIVITSHTIKFLEAAIKTKLNSYVSDNNFCPNQHGFRNGRSIYTAKKELLNYIDIANADQYKSYCCLFIDFSSAYDMVSRQILFKKLKVKQILPEDDIKTIQYIFENLRFEINNKNYKINSGVFQGSTLAPALFDIYIQELIDGLTFLGSPIAYADDLVIVCELQKVKEVWQYLIKWTTCNHMKINVKQDGTKTAIMPLIKSHRFGVKLSNVTRQIKKFQIAPVVIKYCYLGTTIDVTFSSIVHFNVIEKRLASIKSKLSPLLYRGNLRFNINAFFIYAIPQLMMLPQYLKNKTHFNILDKTLKGWFKEFCGFTKILSSSLVFQILGFDTQYFVDFVKDLGDLNIPFQNKRKLRKQNRNRIGMEMEDQLKSFWMLSDYKGICKKCSDHPKLSYDHMKLEHGLNFTQVYDLWHIQFQSDLPYHKRKLRWKIDWSDKIAQCYQRKQQNQPSVNMVDQLPQSQEVMK